MRRHKPILAGLLLSLLPGVAWAHEAYVLTRDQFDQGLRVTTHNPLSALMSTQNIKTFLVISVFVALSYCLAVLFSTTKLAETITKFVRRAAPLGPLIIRMAISASFFEAARSNSFLGPELTLAGIPYGAAIRWLLFLLAIMIFSGFLTELAAAAGLVIMGYLWVHYGAYTLTYTNYLGELLVLLAFGSRFLSVDRWLFGTTAHWRRLEKQRWLEVPVVRILYGIALIYAGYTIKFQHQSLTVNVYNEYHLINYFHLPAAMIAAGAGLAELMMGAFILLGFVMRWSIIVSLIFITLSLLYFHELIWPHLMLYGISFSLLINAGDPLTIDHYLTPWAKATLHKIIRR